ncbi:OmpA/MotB family protein [Photobacterium kagoshimensis]|uniref:OmpA/MotB family protein n=1 Tax=Photobacterium kagoshimensis TaxID=2910242 RepID=UPI003D0DCE3F
MFLVKSKSEESNYMMSVADIMSGLMFIFIITLAIFVVDFLVASRDHEEKMSQLTQVLDKLDENNVMRGQMLTDMQAAMAKKSVEVEIDQEHGVLRLNENAIRFDTGSASLNRTQMERLAVVAEVLASILPCYGLNQPENGMCLPETQGKIDSVFIEGHTDNVPIGGRLAKIFRDNWELSAHRAMFTYRAVTEQQSMLAAMLNNSAQPVISVSGYGEGRPVPGHAHTKPTNDPTNRRIDFRFIMTPPSVTETQAALEGNL